MTFLLRHLCLVAIASLSLVACGGTLEWKEEVQLSDGRIIVIEREQINEGGGDEWASNRSGYKPKEYRIRFASPGGTGKPIEWRSMKKDEGMWPEIPLLFDLYSGQPTIFSLVAVSICCEVYSKYVYRNGNWIEEPLPEQFEQHASNLFFGSHKDMPSFLDLAEKTKRNSGSGYRRALKQIGPNRKVTFPYDPLHSGSYLGTQMGRLRQVLYATLIRKSELQPTSAL